MEKSKSIEQLEKENKKLKKDKDKLLGQNKELRKCLLLIMQQTMK